MPARSARSGEGWDRSIFGGPAHQGRVGSMCMSRCADMDLSRELDAPTPQTRMGHRTVEATRWDADLQRGGHRRFGFAPDALELATLYDAVCLRYFSIRWMGS